MQFKKRFSLAFLLLFVRVSFSQELFLPLHQDVTNRYDAVLNAPGIDFSTDIKPYRLSDVKTWMNVDSVDRTFFSTSTQTPSAVERAIRREHLIHFGSDSSFIQIDPLFDLQRTYNISNGDLGHIYSGGVQIESSPFKKLSIAALYYTGESEFLDYIDKRIETNGVLPGIGTPTYVYKGAKRYQQTNLAGYLSYTPSTQFNIQLGYDKNFFGDGYRSLLLSDNAAPYPFLKITTSVKKLKYINLFTDMTDVHVERNIFNSDVYQRKHVSFHYLSYQIFKRLTLSLFEGVIFRAKDSTSYRGYDWNYINPVIFLRPQEYYLSSSDNSLLGGNIKLKLFKHIVLYGQAMLDEFRLKEVRDGRGWHANKQAFQGGIKMFNFLSIHDLTLKGEFNYVRPFMFTHYITMQNYAHNGQELAHPEGANFKESLAFITYRIKSFMMEVKFAYTIYGDSLYHPETKSYSTYGKNVFLSYYEHPDGDYGYYVGKGNRTDVLYADLRLVYTINPKTNFCIEGIAGIRNIESDMMSMVKSSIFKIGIRTNLQNFYYDF